MTDVAWTSETVVWTSETPPRCLVGFEGCDCDGPIKFDWDPNPWYPPFCECHDCHICGEIDCDGHR
jgi:hypothetical protein